MAQYRLAAPGNELDLGPMRGSKVQTGSVCFTLNTAQGLSHGGAAGAGGERRQDNTAESGNRRAHRPPSAVAPCYLACVTLLAATFWSTRFHVESGSNLLIFCAMAAVLGPRSFSNRTP